MATPPFSRRKLAHYMRPPIPAPRPRENHSPRRKGVSQRLITTTTTSRSLLPGEGLSHLSELIEQKGG